jgi:hypothetical protein
LTNDPTCILDFLRIVLPVKEERIEKMCSFRLYPAFEVETSNPKAPGAQYKQNPSFTMSISKAYRHEYLQQSGGSAGTFPAFITKAFLGDGGDRRDRTDDLKLAKLPLYQLSYVPSSISSHATADWLRCAKMVGLGRLELPTSRLSSARSNQLSYRP